MPKQEPIATSKPSNYCQANASLIRKWLAVFGENYGQEVSPARAAVWDEAFADLRSEALHEAFKVILKTSKFFPTVAEVRAAVTKPDEEGEQLEAERSWKMLEQRRDEWGLELTPHFQGGKFFYPPALDAAAQHALASIGGWERFCDFELEHYSLMKRDFLRAYGYFKETGGLLAPSREEAGKVLAKLRARALPGSLPEFSTGEPPAADEQPKNCDPAKSPLPREQQKASAPPRSAPQREMTDAEWEAEKKRQIEALRKAQSLSQSAADQASPQAREAGPGSTQDCSKNLDAVAPANR